MQQLLESLGIRADHPGASTGEWLDTSGETLTSINPTNLEPIGSVRQAGAAEYEKVLGAAQCAFAGWRMTPAPQRGEVVRQLGEELRLHKDSLGKLVSLECGKVVLDWTGF